MRRTDTGSKDFRTLVSEVAMLECYEATRDLDLTDAVSYTHLDVYKRQDIGIPENLTIAINNASKTGTVTKEEIESKIEPMAVDAKMCIRDSLLSLHLRYQQSVTLTVLLAFSRQMR